MHLVLLTRLLTSHILLQWVVHNLACAWNQLLTHHIWRNLAHLHCLQRLELVHAVLHHHRIQFGILDLHGSLLGLKARLLPPHLLLQHLAWLAHELALLHRISHFHSHNFLDLRLLVGMNTSLYIVVELFALIIRELVQVELQLLLDLRLRAEELLDNWNDASHLVHVQQRNPVDDALSVLHPKALTVVNFE